MRDREYWLEILLKIVGPVFGALAEDRLKEEMPIEYYGQQKDRHLYTHLEALGRSLAGVAPWIELEEVSPAEADLQRTIRNQIHRSLCHATGKTYRDYLNYEAGKQPVVDAAFLAQGLLRSWKQSWLKLDPGVQGQVIECMRLTRKIMPSHNNWLLFSAMIEAFLCKAGDDWDRMRIDYALKQHQQWYKGDGVYGDGPFFHYDYYNSFVIYPMMYDILHASGENLSIWASLKDELEPRIRRYAAIQERSISPEGTFPPIGRSLAYRFGALQVLGQMALVKKLPDVSSPPAVRCAMTSVIRKMMNRDDVFDNKGWLKIGFAGSQPSIAEGYISTGSLYLCTCGLLPLGLPANDPFWTAPNEDWVAKKIWAGADMPPDRAL